MPKPTGEKLTSETSKNASSCSKSKRFSSTSDPRPSKKPKHHSDKSSLDVIQIKSISQENEIGGDVEMKEKLLENGGPVEDTAKEGALVEDEESLEEGEIVEENAVEEGREIEGHLVLNTEVKEKVEEFESEMVHVEETEEEKLPEDLINKFQDYQCDLCNVNLNSDEQSEMHYNGKTHAKNIKKFMISYCTNNNIPLPLKYESCITTSAKVPKKKDTFCRTCNIQYDTKAKLIDHYWSKKHREERFKIKKTKSFELKEYICNLCNVTTTSPDQLNSHYLGKKHKRAEHRVEELKLQVIEAKVLQKLPKPKHGGVIASTSTDDSSDESSCKAGASGTNITQVRENYPDHDKSFYCNICCVNNFSEKELNSHLQSLEHIREEELQKLRRVISQEKGLHECAICYVKNLTKERLEEHLRSATHNEEKKLKKTQLMLSLEAEIKASRRYVCDLCNVMIEPDLFEAHVQTKAHIKALRVVDIEKAKEVEETVKTIPKNEKKYTCYVCGVAMVCGNTYIAHMQSKKHIEKKAKQELNKIFNVENV